MLLNNFFTIEEFIEEKESGTLLVALNSKHEVFQGHFPGQPVVPGVFTLQMIKECMEIVVNKKLQYSEVQNCKFSQAILPGGLAFRIEYQYTNEDKNIQLKAYVKEENITCLSLKARLIESNA